MADKTFVEKLAVVVGSTVVFISLVLVVAPISTGMGALTGWTVGMLFGGIIKHVLAAFGVYNVEVWQLGATLGFVSAFMRTQTTIKKD